MSKPKVNSLKISTKLKTFSDVDQETKRKDS